jgi:hypothetical protein
LQLEIVLEKAQLFQMTVFQIVTVLLLLKAGTNASLVSTPYGRYEMKKCQTCTFDDVRLELSDCSAPFATWLIEDGGKQCAVPSSVVIMVAGGASRAENVHDFAHRLFEANDWSARQFVVLAPTLPLKCDSLAAQPDLRTLADSKFAAEMLADFCVVATRRFNVPGCHFVGLSNGGIATIQMLLHTSSAPILSVTLLAAAALNDEDVEAVNKADNGLCRLQNLQTFVGDLDVPFHEAAIDMHAMLDRSCGNSNVRVLRVLDGVHHWNVVERSVDHLLRSVIW